MTETNLSLETDCLFRCKLIACVIASWSLSSRICQLVILNDASVTLGPPLSHVHRVVGSEAGARVWKVDNFDHLVMRRMYNVSKLINATWLFKSSGIGRIGSVQMMPINLTGCYRIDVAGASGGGNTFYTKYGDTYVENKKPGGLGAFGTGNFNLTAGTQLTVVVGQMGGASNILTCSGGGGGGSFVYMAAAGGGFLLLAAGGGGGASSYCNGQPGDKKNNGSSSLGTTTTTNSGLGGANGQPGFNNPDTTLRNNFHGGCGAGWLGKAVIPRRNSSDGDRGGGLADGWVGGQAGNGGNSSGGFGGGGGSGLGQSCNGAAGAGGGFSGGGAGLDGSHCGGGGGSFCSGSGCSFTTGGNAGSHHGFVSLQLLAPFADTCN